METLTTVLLFAIGVFLIGNILLLILEKRQQKAVKRLPIGSASQEIINSKVDVLNKRVSRLEQKERKKEKPKTVKAIVKKEKKKTTKYPITKYKRKKKV
ncbi:MAG TPA: hypothetical protein P5530_01845 [Candidatus Diapherotrites archaeon]|jgi:hypothetical protein|nr:hypothetical protein [Candidatus Diapherotrites archaeon]